MAQVNILNLPVRIALSGNEYVPGQAVDGTTQRFTTAQIAALGADDVSDAVIVTTIAAMKALNPNDTTLCFLNDGDRSGTFLFIVANFTTEVSADTQNGIYVAPNIDPTGATGAWVRNYSGGANIRWFGAVGDGIANDQPALACALATVDTVFIPEGTFLVSADTSITSNQTLYGAGDGSVLKFTGADNVISVSGTAPAGIVLASFKISSTGTTTENTVGIINCDGPALNGMVIRNVTVNAPNVGRNAVFFKSRDTAEVHNVLIDGLNVVAAGRMGVEIIQH